MERDDLTDFFRRWPYDPEHAVRRIVGADGRPLLQVRLPLGVEQYELEGRPDGRRPQGKASILAVYEEALREHVARRGSDEGFALSKEDCRLLHEEGTLHYYRYLLCYQAGEYDLVLRDTAHNIRIFRLVERYAGDEEDRKALTQYWPYILRMRAMARAFRALRRGRPRLALSFLRRVARLIERLPAVDTPIYALEKERSLKVLDEMARSLKATRPVSEREELIKRLARAVEKEDYAQAARLRDLIARMRR